MLDESEVQRLKALMEWEAGRSATPKGFPKLPDMPAAQYAQKVKKWKKTHISRIKLVMNSTMTPR